MKDLNAIQLFVRVVQLGSLSAAARERGSMPSSVSRHIAGLEQELGTRLFQRTTRKQSLTEAGKVFYDYALRLTEDINTAKRAVSRLSSYPSGTLVVSMEADFSQVFIAPLLPEFFQRYPDIKLRINLNASLLDLIESGTDLAIRMGHLNDSSLVAKKLAISRSRLFASSTYLQQYGLPTQPQQLSQHRCLSFKTQAGVNHWHFEKDQQSFEVVISGHINVNSLTFLKQMALAGEGIVMLPTWVAQTELADGRLVPLLSDYELKPSHTPIQAVFPNNTLLAPKVRAFVDFLAEKLKTL